MPTNRTPAGSAQLHPSGIGDGEGDSRLNSGTVLVVDDESINRKLLTSMLERHGYCAMEACDGDDALEWVRSGKCDLILLDIQMPDRDGFELLAEIRKHRDRTQLPIIIVTANNSTVDIVRAFQCGANDYVSKPIDVDVILARINTHISLQKAQAALRESEERYAVVARGTNDGLWDWNLATNRVYYSPRWLEMLGLENVDMTDSPDEWFSRVHHEDLPRVEAELQMHRVGKTAKFETELRMQHSDGQFRWMLCRGIAIHNGGRNAVRIAGSLTDITEGKVADALTGLPNRLLFMDRVERAVHRAQREVNYKFAVLYLDLDNFKLVNDSLGHDFGDDLLVSVARRIENCVRMSETIVARLGGDEFAILMERAAGVEDAVAVANRIIAALSRPFTFHGRDVFSGASVGIALGERGKRKADELLREADTAMFQAKSEGRGKLRVFDPEMQERVNYRMELENDLQRALERNELELHFQPIVALQTRNVVGFEALIRWRHGRLGMIPPDRFIPIAEETGLIVPIGEWVLREACRQTARWQGTYESARDLIASINVSPRQLAHGHWINSVSDALHESGISPATLKVEITESVIMKNPDEGVTLLNDLRQLGAKVAIDDFGTGYSSLALLHRLPLDILKVDRSFVNKMQQSHENAAIVRTIITLASSLNLDVIAEGIETEEQCQQLAELDCAYGQGYLFSRPVDALEATKILEQQDLQLLTY